MLGAKEAQEPGGGLRPGARSGFGAENLNHGRSVCGGGGRGLDAGTSAAGAWKPRQVDGVVGGATWSLEVRGKATEPRQGERVNVSDRGLGSWAEALLIRGGLDLTGERAEPPLMMAAKVRGYGETLIRLVWWVWWGKNTVRWKVGRKKLDRNLMLPGSYSLLPVKLLVTNVLSKIVSSIIKLIIIHI